MMPWKCELNGAVIIFIFGVWATLYCVLCVYWHSFWTHKVCKWSNMHLSYCTTSSGVLHWTQLTLGWITKYFKRLFQLYKSFYFCSKQTFESFYFIVKALFNKIEKKNVGRMQNNWTQIDLYSVLLLVHSIILINKLLFNLINNFLLIGFQSCLSDPCLNGGLCQTSGSTSYCM